MLMAVVAHHVQAGVLALLLGEFPRFVVIDIAVGQVGELHDLAQGGCNRGFRTPRRFRRAFQSRANLASSVAASLPSKRLAMKPGAAAGDVDELADQIGIDRAIMSSRLRSTSSMVPLDLAAK